MILETPMILALQSIEPSLLYILTGRNGVEPEDPYVAVSVENVTKVGASSRSWSSLVNKEIITTPCEVLYRITLQAQAKDAAQDAFENLYFIMESSFVANALEDNGLGLLHLNNLQYSDSPVDTIMFKQGVFDVTCLINRITEVDSPDIKDVRTRGELEDSYGNELTMDVEVKY